jgi:glycosyltransferase involved in cell wall biosynthesis
MQDTIVHKDFNTSTPQHMNIGIDIRTLLTPVRTGVAEYTYELLQALFRIDRKNQYFLFTNCAKDFEMGKEKWERDNVKYVITKYPNKLFNTSLQLLKRPKLDKLVDRLQTTDYSRLVKDRNPKSEIRSLDVWFSPNIGFTSLSRNVKHVMTIHDLSFEHFPDCYSWKRRLWHKVLNPKKQCERADLILTPSLSTKRDVVETYGIDESKVRCLYPGVTSDFGLQTSDYRQEEVKMKYKLPDKYILFLGTIEPRKNILGLTEAYKTSSLITDHWSLIIAGAKGWKNTSILKAIQETEGVQYIGIISPEDKSALYQLADLFVYPSLYEGFGFPVLEAMASGTPVITSNRLSLPEVANDAAIFVNPMNVSELAEAMKDLLQNEELKSMLIEKGKERVEKFCWEDTAKKFLKICELE